MPLTSKIVDHFSLQPLLWLLMFVFISPVKSQEVERVPVNIFGDGNPMNGVEDSREQIASGNHEADDQSANSMYAGTIHCDKRIRGTGIVVDTREIVPDLKGVVLMSAAHVLYDLKKGRLFRRCEFSFMGWDNLAGYHKRINLKKIRKGGFNPGLGTNDLAVGEGDWVLMYLPKPWKKFNPDHSIQLKEFSFENLESFQQVGGEFRLMAFDSNTGTISQSRNCTVIQSKRDDLGGGNWKGQLLDDCDSGDAASGGGIIAIINQKHFLIGVRSGSHWSEEIFPEDKFPSGPPEGAFWDPRSNTNFGRAIDSRLLEEVFYFINSLEH